MRKILLADDDEALRMLVAATLGGTDDHYLIQARDGLEALELTNSEKPDLILLDVNMPGMDGFAVCEAVKSNPLTKHIAVVILTARGHESDLARGRAAGADSYFKKPFSPLALLNKVHEILGEP